MAIRLTGSPGGGAAPAFDRAALVARGERLLAALDQPEAELSLALVDDETMADMNQRFRGREGPTDVLSFSLVEGEHAEHRGALLGDVIVDLDVALRQAEALGHSLDDELLRLVIHGTLHLLGFDHEQSDEAAVMEARERELWDRLQP